MSKAEAAEFTGLGSHETEQDAPSSTSIVVRESPHALTVWVGPWKSLGQQWARGSLRNIQVMLKVNSGWAPARYCSVVSTGGKVNQRRPWPGSLGASSSFYHASPRHQRMKHSESYTFATGLFCTHTNTLMWVRSCPHTHWCGHVHTCTFMCTLIQTPTDMGTLAHSHA